MTAKATQSIEKSLSLLSEIVASEGRRSALTLADQEGLPRATAHRILGALTRRGFLTRVGHGRYLAGPTLVRLAKHADLSRTLELAGRPILKTLARDTGLTAHLGIFEGDMVTYLAKARGRRTELFTKEGMQLEAYCSGIGKMLLACLPKNEREHYLANGPFVALTPYTIIDPDILRKELAKTRRRRFALDDREIDADLRCLAVPVFDDDGAAVAALSISARGADGPLRHLPRLQNAASALEQKLYGRGA